MKVLLVEDEVHKRDEMVSCVVEAFGSPPDVVDSVSTAVLKVMHETFDLLILDMALSTFGEGAEDNKKGHDQAQGGVEVLRALKAAGKTPKIVIVTQYHDFYIAGKKVKLKDSPQIIKEKYGQKIIGAILYHYKSKPTLQKIVSLLKASK
jgi:CheY-like chemotaxis protein